MKNNGEIWEMPRPLTQKMLCAKNDTKSWRILFEVCCLYRSRDKDSLRDISRLLFSPHTNQEFFPKNGRFRVGGGP